MSEVLNEKPLISVLVPVYNVGKCLEKCLDSIIEQTYNNLQIILVDDGSTDGSGEICDIYCKKDQRVEVYHQENQGVSVARNLAMKYATGDLWFWVDADDYLYEGIIEYLYSLMQKYSADISMCMPKRVDTLSEKYTKKTIDNIKIYTNKEVLSQLYCPEYTFCKTYGRFIAPFAKLIKKSLFLDLQFPIGKFYEDGAVMFIPLHRADKIVCSEEEMYFYFQRSGSISRKKFDATKLDRFEAFEAQMKYYKENNLPELFYMAMCTYLNMFREFNYAAKRDGVGKEYCSIIKKKFRKTWRKIRKQYKFDVDFKYKLEEYNHPLIYGIRDKIRREGLGEAIIKALKKRVI